MCVDNHRVDYGSGRNTDGATGQMQFYRIEHLAAQIMFFEQVAEVENRRLIRHRCTAQIDAGEAPQHRGFVQRILNRGVR